MYEKPVQCLYNVVNRKTKILKTCLQTSKTVVHWSDNKHTTLAQRLYNCRNTAIARLCNGRKTVVQRSHKCRTTLI